MSIRKCYTYFYFWKTWKIYFGSLERSLQRFPSLVSKNRKSYARCKIISLEIIILGNRNSWIPPQHPFVYFSTSVFIFVSLNMDGDEGKSPFFFIFFREKISNWKNNVEREGIVYKSQLTRQNFWKSVSASR